MNRLVDSLGIDPSPRIANIELQILNHDPALRQHPLESNGISATPSILVTDQTAAAPATGSATPPPSSDADDADRSRHAFMRRPDAGEALTGRANELRELERLGHSLQAGGSGIAIITGEAGIGKSALLATAAGRISSHGARVVRSAGTDFAAPKFWIWRQVITELGRCEQGPSGGSTGLEQLAMLGPTVADAAGLEPV